MRKVLVTTIATLATAMLFTMTTSNAATYKFTFQSNYAELTATGEFTVNAANGVTGALSDPTLEIYNSNGDVFRSNDNYTTTVGLNTLYTLGLAPKNSLEAAVYFEGGPGNYTAILRGVGGTTGVGLIEVYGAN